MDTVVIIVLAVVAIRALVALAVTVRRTPTIGQGELPGVQSPNSPPTGSRFSTAIRGLGSTVLARLLLSTMKTTERVTFDGGKTYQDVDDVPDPALREQLRAALHSRTNTVFTESFVVGDKTYHSIDEIPDATMREGLRKTLAGAVARTGDPALKAVLQHELDEADRSVGEAGEQRSGLAESTAPPTETPPAA